MKVKNPECHRPSRKPARRSPWKYPSCILRGDNSVGEFFSVALTSGHQQADTGTKMIHIGKNTKSTIISKGSLPDTARTATAA
ncbi:SufD family Fe-S cluster assembly protein [Escherichia coli]